MECALKSGGSNQNRKLVRSVIMSSIGRNDPCPCGSGKKYKKCCLGKPGASELWRRTAQPTYWAEADVRLLPTEEIINRLQAVGVEFAEERFLFDVKRFDSAVQLANHWKSIYSVSASWFETDFIYNAAIVLWERLAPDVINSEMIDRLIEQGYDLVESNQRGAGCTIWLNVWEIMKPRFTPAMKSIDDVELVPDRWRSFANMCCDLEMELHNAGIDDRAFYERRIQFCREFCALFPESDSTILHNMKRAVAESLFAIGKPDEGERAFKALVEEFPDFAESYFGWGDMYGVFILNKQMQPDFDKAERIYRLGLERVTEGQEVILERLEDLEEERKKYLSNR
ncbi:MAG: SEC-C metal-binding domain-containing protein [Blastocatellia bacterium]